LKIRRNILLASMICFLQGQAQDPQFSQYYSAPLYLNPAFAGATPCSRLIANYRNQWSIFPGSFNTFAVSFDHNFDKQNSGLGFIATTDVAGSAGLRSTELSAIYSYVLKVNKYWSIRAGLQPTFVNRSLDFYRLTFSDQFTNDGPTNNPSTDYSGYQSTINYFDVSSGILAYNKSFWFGVSGNHLNMPNQSFSTNSGVSRLPIKLSFHGGYKILFPVRNRKPKPTDPERSLTPTFMYKHQGPFNQLDIGMYFNYQPFVLGIWYRGVPFLRNAVGYNNYDALFIQVGYQVGNLAFSYSYDYTISGLAGLTGGSHEIAVTYLFCHGKYPVKRKPPLKHQRNPCPQLYEQFFDELPH
ncbi:MAG: type IX secretion system membrane protein PorP/SprF, partial [Cytophagales bacterium]|nr:type IX secretion system membrane protein PorP/SprF [Cytophagales bacterium]